ncbi:MAG: hypothetical protein IIA89_07115 [Chloroflexi bacterium]|nr:hypothetical protein [Chloroflexota bacterium]
MRRRKYIIAIAVIAALIVVGATAFWSSSSLRDRSGTGPSECTVETTPREPCDLDCDGDCDQDDMDIFSASEHMCSYNPPRPQLKYNPLADADGDECVGPRDLLLLFPELMTPTLQALFPDIATPEE